MSAEVALKNIRKELRHIATVPVYFVQGGITKKIKIGFSTQVQNRMNLLASTCFEPIELLGWVPGGPRVEREMHAKFDDYALGHEWFEPAPELLAFIESSTRHDDPYTVSRKYGRITDWGYSSLVQSELHYKEVVRQNKAG